MNARETALCLLRVWRSVSRRLCGDSLIAEWLSMELGRPTAVGSATSGDVSLSHGTVLKSLAPADDEDVGRLGTYEVSESHRIGRRSNGVVLDCGVVDEDRDWGIENE